MSEPKIVQIDWRRIEATRPRHAGSNARLGDHGLTVRPGVARVTTDDDSVGIGPARLTRELAASLIGQPLETSCPGLFGRTLPTGPAQNALEYPLLDLLAKREVKPAYVYLADRAGRSLPFSPDAVSVRVYDTSLYFDDLKIEDEGEAAALIAQEAREGFERGHRAFKIKVGRGARHLPLEEGTRRDIAIVRAVRQAVGPDAPLMIDANNGYNLNLAKRVLKETADCRLFWIEEAFHEDLVLYRDLKEWLAAEGIATIIADGEGQASPTLLDWAKDGLIGAVQYDVFNPGLCRWLEIGPELDEWGVYSAPHHYGAFFGNFLTGHLIGAIERLYAVEWDDAQAPGVDTSAYRVIDGRLTLPDLPGFGIAYDEALFAETEAFEGFTVE